MREATLAFPLKKGKVLLGWKKRGFGAQRWNGFGGKIEEGESVEEALARELEEEVGLLPLSYEKVAHLLFTDNEGLSFTVHAYFVYAWKGYPKESEEMKPQWFPLSALPYEQMWEDDRHWLPLVLKGWRVKGTFHFSSLTSSPRLLSATVERVGRIFKHSP